MSQREYLWDRGGAAEPELEALERGLAALAEEGDALLDSIDFEALALADTLGEDEPARARSLDLGAEVVPLPLPEPPIATLHGDEPERGGEPGRARVWWMGAAAAALLGFSALTLMGDRAASPVAVAGGSEASVEASRLELVVTEVDTELEAEREHVLDQLRPLHRALVDCLAPVERAGRIELSVVLTGEATTELAIRGDLDERGRACLVATFASWDSRALGRGHVELELWLEPAAPR